MSASDDPAAQLDALIPPPWPASRRASVFVAAACVLAVVLALVRSGAVGPRLAHDDAWGSSVTTVDHRLVAERIVLIRNRGWVDVTLHAIELPELAGVTWGEVAGLPATVPPGETQEVRVGFSVEDCLVDIGGYDVFELHAESGVAPPRDVTVAPPGSSDPTLRTTYLDGGGQVTLPAWPDQPPSWLLDTIGPACSTPPDGDDGR